MPASTLTPYELFVFVLAYKSDVFFLKSVVVGLPTKKLYAG
ncbi:unnamed protein product [Schistosoma mattheei]|uniref:Uncharacterized protein n=1 Tax=Schistosoma mattheei TaxID=31246 RepID=A0A183Q334_9TREM|nr:unnamed protein product [Schistosoma mattheei]